MSRETIGRVMMIGKYGFFFVSGGGNHDGGDGYACTLRGSRRLWFRVRIGTARLLARVRKEHQDRREREWFSRARRQQLHDIGVNRVGGMIHPDPERLETGRR